jgi:hypothetical protein
MNCSTDDDDDDQILHYFFDYYFSNDFHYHITDYNQNKGSVDYQTMEMDWNMNEDEILKLKKKVQFIITNATENFVDENSLLKDRNKLSYGRIYIENGVQSFEYLKASFGGTEPIGPMEAVISDTTYGCNTTIPEFDLHDKILIVMRGECSFLNKSTFAMSHHARGLIIVNHEDRLESPSSGLGVDKSINESVVNYVQSLSIIATSNITWEKFLSITKYKLMLNRNDDTSDNDIISQSYFHPFQLQIVPLKCQAGGKCFPILEEEKMKQAEITSGVIELIHSNGTKRSYEFITSNFGGILPLQSPFRIHSAHPKNACEPLTVTSSINTHEICSDGTEQCYDRLRSPSAILASRGECRFDVKAFHIQNKNAQLGLIFDESDGVLQRLGGMTPEVGFVGIPLLYLPLPAGQFIDQSLQHGHVTGQLFPYGDNRVFDKWIDLSEMEWVEDLQERRIQITSLLAKYRQEGNREIVSWLERKLKREMMF